MTTTWWRQHDDDDDDDDDDDNDNSNNNNIFWHILSGPLKQEPTLTSRWLEGFRTFNGFPTFAQPFPFAISSLMLDFTTRWCICSALLVYVLALFFGYEVGMRFSAAIFQLEKNRWKRLVYFFVWVQSFPVNHEAKTRQPMSYWSAARCGVEEIITKGRVCSVDFWKQAACCFTTTPLVLTYSLLL